MLYPRLLSVALAAFVFSLASHQVSAQVLLNGGFELPAEPAGSENIVTPTDWSATGGGVALVSNTHGTLGNTPYGNQYVVPLIGDILSQTVSGFTQGQTYVLGFDYAYETGTESSPLTVSLSGADVYSSTFSLNGAGLYDNATIPFQSNAIIFTPAASGSITFSFFDAGADVALDNVGLYGNIVTPPPTTPEPSTYAEMLLGMLALGAFGLMRRQSTRA